MFWSVQQDSHKPAADIIDADVHLGGARQVKSDPGTRAKGVWSVGKEGKRRRKIGMDLIGNVYDPGKILDSEGPAYDLTDPRLADVAKVSQRHRTGEGFVWIAGKALGEIVQRKRAAGDKGFPPYRQVEIAGGESPAQGPFPLIWRETDIPQGKGSRERLITWGGLQTQILKSESPRE